MSRYMYFFCCTMNSEVGNLLSIKFVKSVKTVEQYVTIDYLNVLW